MSLETQERIARVLVVDDEQDICELIADTLREDGVDVIAATSGSEAIEAARADRPDLVVADLKLGDCHGLDLIGSLREVDMDRLRRAVLDEIGRQDSYKKMARRRRRIRELSRHVHQRRRRTVQHLTATCDDLTAECRDLQDRMARQDELIRYQSDLLAGANEDDTFSRFFRMFVHRTGPLFGVALLCDENAELQMVGRFGVPVPDGVNFCRGLAMAVIDPVLASPDVQIIDAMDSISLFPKPLRRLLVGVTVMAVPLMVGPGQLIGLAVLYRKGEQPFTDDDLDIAHLIAPPTAAAVQRVA